jgi:hypothetical protein
MALLKKRLAGSTLVEMIVASILFLVIFLLAIDTVTRVGTLRRDDALLAVEMDLKACIQEFSTAGTPLGAYRREYGWGGIDVAVKPYREMADIRELELICRIDRHRTLQFRRLIPAND